MAEPAARGLAFSFVLVMTSTLIGCGPDAAGRSSPGAADTDLTTGPDEGEDPADKPSEVERHRGAPDSGDAAGPGGGASQGNPGSDPNVGSDWITTWGAAMQPPVLGLDFVADVLENLTIRQIVRVSLGGRAVRVRLSNAFGATPLRIDAASVAISAAGADVVAGTQRVLTFAGAGALVIPPGGETTSDHVDLQISDNADLAISLFVSAAAPATTQLIWSHQTSYLSGPGNFAANAQLDVAGTLESWYWLSSVEVRHPGASSIVALGDSITEGFASTTDANLRWPDVLARRLLACGAQLGVVNSGISGNRVLNDDLGPSLLSRVDRDLIKRTGARYAILLEGTNDIGYPGLGILNELLLSSDVAGPDPSAQDVIDGYRQIVQRAHAAGITIYGGTLLPMGGAFYADEASERKRQTINEWIRSAQVFDGVIDFDAALRDPAQPDQMLPEYDSGDHLHPNDAGYEAMGNAIDLGKFVPGAHCDR